MSFYMNEISDLTISLEENNEEGRCGEEDISFFDVSSTVASTSPDYINLDTLVDEEECGMGGVNIGMEDALECEQIEFKVRVNSDNELNSDTETDNDDAKEQKEDVEEEGTGYTRLQLPRLSVIKQTRVKDEFVMEETSHSGSGLDEGEEAAASRAMDTLIDCASELVVNGARSRRDTDTHRDNLCPLCAQTGVIYRAAKNVMTEHFLQAHNVYEDGFACSECNYKTRQSGHLKSHINAVHRQLKYSCDLCDFQTKWKNRIKTHKVSVHKEGGLPCPSCDYMASESWVLAQHVKVVHREMNIQDSFYDAKYKCSYCNYKANQKSHLKSHVDALHQQVVFRCDMCSFQTKWKSRLKGHMKAKHMGIFLYCDHCEFKTIEKHTLRKHIIKKHGDIKFACFSCNENFLTRIELKKHMGDVHHMEIL